MMDCAGSLTLEKAYLIDDYAEGTEKPAHPSGLGAAGGDVTIPRNG
jgi:hypothetical protein